MDLDWLIGIQDLRTEIPDCTVQEKFRDVLSSTDSSCEIPFPVLSRVLDYYAACNDPTGKTLKSISIKCGQRYSQLDITVHHDLSEGVGILKIQALSAGGPHGFETEHGLRPWVCFRHQKQNFGEQTLVVNITREYLERILKKHCWLNILAQIIGHALSVHVEGLNPLEALLKISGYNSFQTTTDMLSDVARDILESYACLGNPSSLETFIKDAPSLVARIQRHCGDKISKEDLGLAGKLIARMVQEAHTLLRLYNLEDYSTGSPLNITPSDFIYEQYRSELTLMDVPTFYTPPYLAGNLSEAINSLGYTGENESGVRIIRDIIAFKPAQKGASGTSVLEKIRHWVDLFMDFSEQNIYGLSLIKSGTMEDEDIAGIEVIISNMIKLRSRLCSNNDAPYEDKLKKILLEEKDSLTLGFALNKIINEIHQDVLRNVFGIFKGWKSILGEVNTVSSRAVNITVDSAGTIEYFPANKVNIIDYSGDFRDGKAVVAKTILESYLLTNVHLRDNCYIDCISHTNKAWFFVDLGVHGANIFVDLEPNKRSISASYAEGDVEDGNMVRLRFLREALEELGFTVNKTEITFNARLDEGSAGILDADEIVQRAIWTIQAFASVADFDQEIEDGRISDRSLKYHRARISSSGTGFPLYKMTKGVRELKRLSAAIDEVNAGILSIVNPELIKLGLAEIDESTRGSKAIEQNFNKVILKGMAQGRFLCHVSRPVFANPGYNLPDPASYLDGLLEHEYLEKIACTVNTLDKVVGSTYISMANGNRITLTRVDILSGKIGFYALRDENTYKALRAFAVDGEYLTIVSGYYNIIRDTNVVHDLLTEHGYQLDAIEKRNEWSAPMAPIVKGIAVPAIKSCTGVATGFLKKNRRDSAPADFCHAIFSDHILTPHEVGRLKDAAGFITTDDSTLSHAQLTARTFNKPGVIMHGAQWIDDDQSPFLMIPVGSGSYQLRPGQVITVDASRGLVNIAGASIDEKEDASATVKDIFSLLVMINDQMQAPEALSRLRNIIMNTKDAEILKFIVQELFITSTLMESIHKIEIMKYLLDESADDLRLTIEEYIRDIIVDHRRRLKIDTAMAKKRLLGTSDINEAMFVRNKLSGQLGTFQNMEAIVCDRIGLVPLNYSEEIHEINVMYENIAEDFRTQAINTLHSLDQNLTSLEMKDLEKLMRILRSESLLQAERSSMDETFTCLKSQMEDHLPIMHNRFRSSSKSMLIELSDCSSIFSEFVGNKAASLGDLLRTHSGIRVPPGFVLTSIGIEQLLDHNAAKAHTIQIALEEFTGGRAGTLDTISTIATGFEYPETLKEEIILFYHSLENDEPSEPHTNVEDVFVVVRSSSILEDTFDDMMAGRFKSYPYVRGEKILLEAILKCLAFYWVETGDVSTTQPVFIHKQIEADASMVVNSINMADQRWDEVIINSARGAGSGLVAGKVDSDLYFVDASTYAVKRAINPTKLTKSIFDKGKGYGTKISAIENRAEQIRPSLSEEDASRVAQLARQIHDFFGYPVDIEAVITHGKISIVQVRPIVLP
jgi:phosphoenolpyruvate synthase/pyruvate phosphate dikinase